MRQKRSDPRSTEQLIQLALSETNDDAAWEPVMVLHFRATSEVLETAKRLCIGAAPRERKLGADILGQLGVPDRAFPDECFHTLARMVTDETDSEVLESIGIAFGHLHDIRAVELLAPLRHHISAASGSRTSLKTKLSQSRCSSSLRSNFCNTALPASYKLGAGGAHRNITTVVPHAAGLPPFVMNCQTFTFVPVRERKYHWFLRPEATAVRRWGPAQTIPSSIRCRAHLLDR